MPKVSEAYRQNRRRQVAEAAVRQIRRNGLRGTTMADIITESGLSAGAIYSHFTGKDEILAEVARIGLGGVAARLADARRARPLPDPGGLIEAVLPAPGDLVDPGLIVQLWGEAVVEPRIRAMVLDQVHGLETALTGYASDWLTQVQAVDAAQRSPTLARVLLAVAQAHLLQVEFTEVFDPQQLRAAIDQVAASYAAAPAAEPVAQSRSGSSPQAGKTAARVARIARSTSSAGS